MDSYFLNTTKPAAVNPKNVVVPVESWGRGGGTEIRTYSIKEYQIKGKLYAYSSSVCEF